MSLGIRKLPLLLIACAASAVAQFNSSIEGTITDSSGAVVPAVTIRATNQSTGVTSAANTSEAGYYIIPALPPGRYRVEASKPGFNTAVRTDVILESARVQSVPLVRLQRVHAAEKERMVYTHTFSPRFVNTIAGAFTRNFGASPLNHPNVPAINISGMSGFGGGWGPAGFVQNDFHWRDLASFNRGSHTFKASQTTASRATFETPQFTDFVKSNFPNNGGWEIR